MKKLLSLMLAVVMLFLLVACQDEEPVTTPAPEPIRGTIADTVYKNDYLGLEFTRPDSWVYSTDDEIAQAMNIGVEKLLGENFKEVLENNPSIYDMMVVDTISRSSINVGYENLSKTMSTNITVEQYIAAVKKQFESITEMTVTFPDTYDKVKLGETEFTRVVCSTTASGVNMTQVYYLRKMDGYMGFVIATIVKDYTVADIEAMFK